MPERRSAAAYEMTAGQGIWCAGATGPGNVVFMFFQTPIYE